MGKIKPPPSSTIGEDEAVVAATIGVAHALRNRPTTSE
jgi:hypothetical protein